MTRIAYLGPAGTYTEEATLRYQPDADLVPCQTEAATAAAVESGAAGEAVLAIENSLEGSVTRTIDLLIHDSPLLIKRELVLPIEHCLIVRPGTTPAQVNEVWAHPQALAQCRTFIETRLPGARPSAAFSNAAAVEQIMARPNAAAIAGERAAAIYGAQVLERGIGDSAHNRTRFAVLGREDAAPTGHDKTSIAFTVRHDQPGTLIGVLREFSDRAINLTKIESRPSREELGIYIFLVDLDGHRTDPPVAEALAAVEAKSFFFRLLGSYPRAGDA